MCDLYGGDLQLDIALRGEDNIAYLPYFLGFVLLEVFFFSVGLYSFSLAYAVVMR